MKDYAEGGEKQKLHLADTLLDLLSVLVEFWCQQHLRLNQNLVEKGLKDLAEHFAVISQGKDFFLKKQEYLSFCYVWMLALGS